MRIKKNRPTLLLLLIIGTLLLAPTAVCAQRILVFPLDQTEGTHSTEWIGTGLAVGMNERLALGRVNNVPYEELRRFYEQEGLVTSPEFSLSARTGLARHLGTSGLVSGTYRASEGRLEVHLEVLRLSEGIESLGSWSDSEPIGNLLALTRRLGDRVLKVMGYDDPLTMEAVDPQAFESYIRGRITEDPTLQEVYFRKALEIEPDYHNARCQLAEVLKRTGQSRESREILEELEPLSYSKAYLGLLLLADFRIKEGDFAGARQLLMVSLQEREGAEAHLLLAKLYLYEIKPEEALRELSIAEHFGSLQGEIDAMRTQIQGDDDSEDSGEPEPEAEPGGGK